MKKQKIFVIIILAIILSCFMVTKSYGHDTKIISKNVNTSFDIVSENIAPLEIEEIISIESNSTPISEKISKPVNIEEKSETVWIKENCNAHKIYNKLSEILKELKKDTKVTLTGICENGWSEISFENNKYYVLSDKITTENPVKPVVENKDESPVEIPKGIIIDGASNSVAKTAIKYWNMIPSHIRQAFVADGWELVITTKSLEDMFSYNMSIIGITTYGESKIYVEARDKAIRRALCHEMGHYWDHKQGGLSHTEEFETIFNEERYTFKEIEKADNHCISSTVEFFAEIFAQSLMYPDTCYSTAPKACKYIWG